MLTQRTRIEDLIPDLKLFSVNQSEFSGQIGFLDFGLRSSAK